MFMLDYGLKCTCCALFNICRYLRENRDQNWEKSHLLLSENGTHLITQEKNGKFGILAHTIAQVPKNVSKAIS